MWHVPREDTGLVLLLVLIILITKPVKQLCLFNILNGGKQVYSDFHGIFSQLQLGVSGCFLIDFTCFSINPHYRSVNKFNEVKMNLSSLARI